MLTKTIGQLSSASSLASVDYLEVEISGASRKVDVGMVGDALTATSAQSLVGSSNDVFITPATLRAGLNAENAAPVYACRAWVNFDGATTTSSLTGTYTRVVGTTTTVMVATAHGYITGNVANVDFTSGGASDNSYVVTVTDSDTFTVQTVSTSSVLTSAFTLRRCPIAGGGNVNSVSYLTAGTYLINFAVAMPGNYSMSALCHGTSYGLIIGDNVIYPTPSVYYNAISCINTSSTPVTPKVMCQVIA
jgi:hypothetical protein